MFFPSHGGLQKFVCSVIKDSIFPEVGYTQLKQLCIERCVKLFAPFDICAGAAADFEEAFEVLDGVGSRVGMKVVKTWLNGWATSHRMHEDHALDCLFGCKDAADSMGHYVFCPHLCAFQAYLFQGIAADPLVRFGIKSPRVFSLKVCSCLFSAYHALKGEVRAGKINMHEVNWLSNAWSVFAKAVKAEAGEMLLETRVSHWRNSLTCQSMGGPAVHL